MSDDKKCIESWIKSALDNQSFEQLKWIDKNKKIFGIKWVHAASSSWNPKHAEVFVEYARCKGRLQGREKNFKLLKALFRNALNSRATFKHLKTRANISYWKIFQASMKRKSCSNSKHQQKFHKRCPKTNTQLQARQKSKKDHQDLFLHSSTSKGYHEDVFLPPFQTICSIEKSFHMPNQNTELDCSGESLRALSGEFCAVVEKFEDSQNFSSTQELRNKNVNVQQINNDCCFNFNFETSCQNHIQPVLQHETFTSCYTQPTASRSMTNTGPMGGFLSQPIEGSLPNYNCSTATENWQEIIEEILSCFRRLDPTQLCQKAGQSSEDQRSGNQLLFEEFCYMT